MLTVVENAKIESLCAVVSSKNITVEKRLENLIDSKKISRLKKITGFDSFSVAEEEICASDFCVRAAEILFDSEQVRRDEIRALIFVTQTADYFMPSTACTLQKRLNLPNDIAAFDLSLGCSGFVYGLYVASSMLQNLTDGKILLLCGDTSTRNICHDDTSCLSIFGDAGVAAVISKSAGKKIFFNLQTFGELSETIIIRRGAYRNQHLVENNSLDVRENFVFMNGLEVVNFSSKYVPQNIADLIHFAKADISEIGAFLLHQANKSIVESIAAKLQIPSAKVPFRASNIGNTSSASIPLILSEMKRLNEQTNFLSLISGFGVGMSIASAVIDFSDLLCLPTEKLVGGKNS